ncbi:hypothetical protein MNBD_GAMMA09-2137 [hydrothermal vent metagenome]|uniref:Uncharacterized protein n=1 Tax=hydrothermal vent metagenome TaxID=652676 RepID=A0A3B0YNE5_9ZZZZ
MNKKLIVLLCGLFVTGAANAECPSELNKEELIECQKNEASLEGEPVAESDSTISPVTGEDITKIQPAAGKPKPEAKTKSEK